MGTERGPGRFGQEECFEFMHLGFWGTFMNYIILPVYRL
jgi:hypothetical protein